MHPLPPLLPEPYETEPVECVQPWLQTQKLPFYAKGEEGVVSECNYRGGINGIVRSGMFRTFSRVVLYFPPLKIDTYEIDNIPGWTMKVCQKSRISRPRISIFNYMGFGVRIRIPAGMYNTLDEIFWMINKTFQVEGSELSSLKTITPTVITKFVHTSPLLAVEDIVSALARDNAATMGRLGQWRPGKPSRENVVDIADFMVNGGTPQIVDFNIAEKIKALG